MINLYSSYDILRFYLLFSNLYIYLRYLFFVLSIIAMFATSQGRSVRRLRKHS